MQAKQEQITLLISKAADDVYVLDKLYKMQGSIIRYQKTNVEMQKYKTI